MNKKISKNEHEDIKLSTTRYKITDEFKEIT